jgi:hypothetical protein
VGLTNLSCKKKIVEKPPRIPAGFCGGGQGLSWSVEPRKERKKDNFSNGNYAPKNELNCIHIDL